MFFDWVTTLEKVRDYLSQFFLVLLKNQYLTYFSLAIICSLILTFLCIKLAYRLGIVDKPDGILKVHKQTTPYLGGLGVYLTLFLPLYFLAPFLLPGLTVLFLTGLIDDMYRLRPSRLFLGHMLGASLLAFFIPRPFIFENVALQYLLMVFWLASVINSFNLIDVMDGLLGCACSIMGFGFGIYSYLLGQYNYTVLSVAAMGALAGFLYFNKPRAKIYMGDSGSLYLGGLFGSLSLLLHWQVSGISFFFIPISLLCIPIGELLLLMGVRTYKGIPFFKGSPDHFSHYLKKKGWSVSQILVIMSLLSCSAFILSFLYFSNFISVYTYCAFVAGLFLSFVIYLLQ